MFLRPGFQVKPSSGGGGSSPAHSAYGAGNVHEPFNWIVADAAAKTALAPVVADLYKALWQIDTGIVYILTSVSPIVWAAIGGSGGGAVSPTTFVGPVFYAWQNAAQTFAAGATNRIICNIKVYDTDSGFDPATGIFTCPVAGYYHFTGRVGSTTGLSLVTDVKIRKNNIEILGGQLTTSSNNDWMIGGDILLAVGDTVDLAFFSSSGYTTTNQQLNTYFQGHYIRPPVGSANANVTDKARISKTTAQNTVAANVTKVLFNNITYDSNGLVNIANNRIVIKKPGYYRCSFRTSISAAAGTQRIFTQLLKNGAEVSRGIDLPIPSGSGGGSSGVDTVLCSAGDYLEVTVFTALAVGIEAFDFTTFLAVEGPI